MMTDAATTDEKSSGAGKLESMSKEELIKIVKNQILLKKKLESKIAELLASNSNFYRNEEQLRKELIDDRSKYSKLLIEFDQNKLQLSKIREELSVTCQSLELIRLENENLTAGSQNLQDEVLKLQNELTLVRSSSNHESQSSSSDSELLRKFISTTTDLLELPISSSSTLDNQFFDNFRNELEQKQENLKQIFEQLEQDKTHLQQRIEDLEFLNEEVKLEIDDLRVKSLKHQQDKQYMEKEIDNYRRQVEDFEEQFLELQRESHNEHISIEKKPPQSSSHTLSQQSEENNSTPSMNSTHNKIDDFDQRISKSSSTSSLLLSSDIPTLLHSIGITNCTDEDFSVPLNFESVLRLCTLLIERCRVLQYILLKNNDVPTTSSVDNDYFKDCVLFLQNNNCEQCKLFIHRQDHIALDTLFERIYCGMNETMQSNDWHIIIEKPIDQKTPLVRLEFDHFKFVPQEVEQSLIRLRSQYEQLSKENEEQRKKISDLEHRLFSNTAYEQLKQHQAQLEKQLSQQCEKTIQLENILKQENIVDKIKFDQLQQIEVSYDELQAKYRIAEQLEKQLEQLNETMNKKDVEFKRQQDLFEKLKVEYDNQHAHSLECDENIRILKSQLEQNDQFKESLIDKYQNQIKQIHKDFEQQKLLLLNAANNQDEHYSLIAKQQTELNDSIKAKTDENFQLNNDLKRNNQLILDKTKRIDELQNQLNLLNIERDELKDQFSEIKEEKTKLASEINVLLDKITCLEKEKLEYIKNIVDLKEQLEANPKAMNQEKSQLQQTDENLQDESELNKMHSQDITLNQTIVTENFQSELETIRKETGIHTQNANDTNETIQKQRCDSGENIQDLKEKYHKMKILLTRLKRELQDKNQHQPKQSLIDLELADYEKTIKNLKDDLLNKDKEIQELNDELSNSTDKFKCLKLENKNLEQQIIQLEERANKFKTLLDIAKKELQHAKELEIQRHYNDDHIRVLLEKLQKEVDDNKILISELQSEKQQLIEKRNNHNETSQKAINLLEQNLSIAKHDLDIAKRDYDTLQDDFNSYKIRAQCVLKQHQLSQRERTPSVVEKQVELEETIEKLNATLREANEKIQLLLSENDALQKEYDHLIENQAQLINDSRKREQDLRRQHKTEIDKCENEYLQRINDSHNMLKTIKLQSETLSTTFREQIASMELEQDRTISRLQNELETSRLEIDELKNRIGLLEQTNNNYEILISNAESSNFGINSDPSLDDTLACRISERQQSEELNLDNGNQQSSNVVNKMTNSIHYDSQNSNIDNTSSISSTLNSKLNANSLESIDLERQRLEEELHKTKIRLLDITDLFNESESNNVRLNEQVSLLKDEIRRIERNMERAESISNLEYLKNVILNFFILKSAPERLQLIPVLVTMLKLSPDEQAQLVRAANSSKLNDENSKGNESPTQQMPSDPSAPSWSSYLNMW